MIGGYLTFQGIQAKGNYHSAPIDDILPVSLYASDDRCKSPQGVTPLIVDADHPTVAWLSDWSYFLGCNRSRLRTNGHLVVSIGDDPLIAARDVGSGRTAVFSSDCGPHWGPPAFVNWAGYPKLWVNIVECSVAACSAASSSSRFAQFRKLSRKEE